MTFKKCCHSKFRSQPCSVKYKVFIFELSDVKDLLYPSLCADTVKERNTLRLGVVPENTKGSNMKTAIMQKSSHSKEILCIKVYYRLLITVTPVIMLYGGFPPSYNFN